MFHRIFWTCKNTIALTAVVSQDEQDANMCGLMSGPNFRRYIKTKAWFEKMAKDNRINHEDEEPMRLQEWCKFISEDRETLL